MIDVLFTILEVLNNVVEVDEASMQLVFGHYEISLTLELLGRVCKAKCNSVVLICTHFACLRSFLGFSWPNW